MNHLRYPMLVLALAVPLLLAACGGHGGYY